MHKIILLFSLGFILSLGWSCKTKTLLETPVAPEPLPMVKGNEGKIDFDVNSLNEDGLMGNRGGLVSVDYNFCFTSSPENDEAIRNIDPSITITNNPPGGAKCRDGQALAMGNTQQPNHKQILFSLSNLDYVARIKRVWYE